MSLLSSRLCWAEQAVNCLLKACAIAFELEWVFPSKVIEMFGGESTSCRLACAEENSNAWDWWRGWRTPKWSSTGRALHGK